MAVAQCAAVVFDKWLFLPLLGSALCSCAIAGSEDSGYSDEALLVLEAPARGSLSELGEVQVRGRLTAGSVPVSRVAVNGRIVSPDETGYFELSLNVPPGLTFIHATATDLRGTELARETRSVMSGPFTSVGAAVERGVVADFSPASVAELARMAARLMADASPADLAAGIDPLFSTGSGCLSAKATVASLDVGQASLDASPIPGALDVDLTLNQIALVLDIDFTLACQSGTVRVAARADRYELSGELALAIAAGRATSSLDASSTDLDNFAIEFTGISVVDDALTNVDWLVGLMLRRVVENRLGPAIVDALGQAADNRTEVTPAGQLLTAEGTPTKLRLDSNGLQLEVATRIAGTGDSGPGYVSTEASKAIGLVDVRFNAGFGVAVADEAVNQALSAVWAAGGLTMAVPAPAARRRRLRRNPAGRVSRDDIAANGSIRSRQGPCGGRDR